MRDVVGPLSSSTGASTSRHNPKSADQVSVAYVDPLLHPSPKLLYANIVSSLGLDPASLSDDSVDAFIEALQTRYSGNPHRKGIIVIQRAERIRDMWPEFVWETLFSLAEQVSVKGQAVSHICFSLTDQALENRRCRQASSHSSPSAASLLITFAPLAVLHPSLGRELLSASHSIG